MRNQSLILALALALLTASCGVPGPLAPVGQMIAPECPLAVNGTLVLKNSTDGYCLLYPAGYDIVQPSDGVTVISFGSIQNVDGARLNIEVREVKDATTESAANQVAEDVQTSLPGFLVKRTTTTVSGKAAVLLDGLPGQEISRVLVFVSGNRMYKLSFVPAGADAGDAHARMEALYQTVVDSLRLLG